MLYKEEGGYIPRAIDHSIYTLGDSVDEIREMIKDAVICHFNDNPLPRMIRLHFGKNEVLAV